MNPLHADLVTDAELEAQVVVQAEVVSETFSEAPSEIMDTDWLCIFRVGGLAITAITVCLVFYNIAWGLSSIMSFILL